MLIVSDELFCRQIPELMFHVEELRGEYWLVTVWLVWVLTSECLSVLRLIENVCERVLVELLIRYVM